MGALLVAFAAIGLFAAGASAATGHAPEPFSPLDGSGSGVTIHEPSGIAVDESTGNVFITDGTNSPSILILGGEGGAPVGLKPPYSISGVAFGTAPTALAFDNSSSSVNQGALYAYDTAAEKVKKFTRNSLTETYEPAGEFSVPAGTGEVGAGIGADGNLWLGSPGKQEIFEYSPAGTQLHHWNVKDPLQGIGKPSQLAPDLPGFLFAQRIQGSGIFRVPINAGGEVEKEKFIKIAREEGAATGVAYDPGTDHVYAAWNRRMGEYDATTLAPIATKFGEAALTQTGRVAVDSSTERIYVVDVGSKDVVVFGPPVELPTVELKPASEITTNEATLNGSVNLEGRDEVRCEFEYGTSESALVSTAPCEQSLPTDSQAHAVTAKLVGLQGGEKPYFYRLIAESTAGSSVTSTGKFVTRPTVEARPATVHGIADATLNGVVNPEDLRYTECFFEWGLASEGASYEHTAQCEPEASAIPADSKPHVVGAELGELEEATKYRFRLVATNSEGKRESQEETFETAGPPRLGAVRASDAGQDRATLEAEIEPNGFATSYRFEWGPTSSYGNLSPAAFELAGSGFSPIRATTELSGLSAGTTYHYRVVASGHGGTVRSVDHEVETLNSCNLPAGRCLEMVSPRQPGLVALPLERLAGFEMPFQAAEQSGSLAYEVELGFAGATTGGETLYVGSRHPGGWETDQYSPPLPKASQGGGVRYRTLALSPELSCGVVASRLPLTPDPVGRLIIEAGGGNLYRRGPDGTYTLITNRVPELLSSVGGEIDREFELVGMSRDCDHVVFSTQQRYQGVPGTGTWRLYEWDEGTLRNVASVPDGSGEAAVEAVGGGAVRGEFGNTYDAVSEDGSRAFFTATSKAGNDSGNTAVFARIDGMETLDVSQSALEVDTGATFQGATPDGSRVYFTANAGLTADSSPAGRDLYECHIVTGVDGHECELTDLSVDLDPGGAEAGGPTQGGDNIGALVGLAADGSRVYFVARGQLVPGRGRTFAQNQAANTFSLYVYESSDDTVMYIGAVGGSPGELAAITTGNLFGYKARTSTEGRYLLFESTQNLSSYDSGGKPEVYLYDDEVTGSEEALVCVSCRQDGKPTANSKEFDELLTNVGRNTTYLSQSLVLRGGQPHVFFRSRDRLAPGAQEGEWALYEWAHGQVFAIANDLPGATPLEGGSGTIEFLGASSDGTDMYFVDSAALNWENANARRVVWDARIGGGFQQPSAIGPCDPGLEGSCQGVGVPAPPAPPVGTTVNGAGNPKPNKHHKRKHHKRKHHKRKHHKRKHAGRANADRGIGK